MPGCCFEHGIVGKEYLGYTVGIEEDFSRIVFPLKFPDLGILELFYTFECTKYLPS